MYCSKCGVENTDGSTHCTNCGEFLTAPIGAAVAAPVPQAKTSGLAITAFILGLLCLTCVLWPLLGLPAIICGILALVQINKSGGRLKGTVLAVAGLVIAAVLTLILPIFLSIMMPALSKAREMAKRTVCITNMHELAIAATTQSGDGQLPEQWCDFLIEKADVLPKHFVCPEDKETAFGYAINKNILTASPQRLSPQTVVFFEADLGKNGAGGPADVIFRHRSGTQPACNITFADGHVELVTQDRIGQLQWTAE